MHEASVGIDLATDVAPTGPARPGWRFWLAYWGFWWLLGLSLALAEFQDPSRHPARRDWEPFVLEISSLLASGALALAVHRGVAWLGRQPRGWPRLVLAHGVGASLFCVSHVALMYLLRGPLYLALAGRWYAPMSPTQALAFEGAKDLVTYIVIAALAYALQLRQREQAQGLRLARSQAALTQLRLDRLSQQLQPHFLFNCLNAVASLVEENPKVAVTMIARIGDFLRGALHDDGGARTTLRDEIGLARDYLAIQALRFEGRLALDFDVPPALEASSVPRLLLQPLVENAVKHGMVGPDALLRVSVRARREGGRLRLEVHNQPAAASASRPGSGKGLALVRRRLELEFGTDASLQLSHGKDGFGVVVELPLEEAAR